MPESPVNCGHCLFPEPLYIQVIWLFAQPPKIIKSTGLLFSEDNTSSIKTVALEKNSWVSFGRREWKYSPTSTVTVDSPSTKASDSWIHTCFKCGYGVKPLETIFGWWTSKTTNYFGIHRDAKVVNGFNQLPYLRTHFPYLCQHMHTPRVRPLWQGTASDRESAILGALIHWPLPNSSKQVSTSVTSLTCSHLKLTTSLTTLRHDLQLAQFLTYNS